MPLRDFRPRFGDINIRNQAVLNLSNITSFAIQVSGGDNIGQKRRIICKSLIIFYKITAKSFSDDLKKDNDMF